MATIVKVMQLPDSGLEIRDRMWLKITISNAVIGKQIPGVLVGGKQTSDLMEIGSRNCLFMSFFFMSVTSYILFMGRSKCDRK